MVHRLASNDNEWQRMTSSSTTNDNEWYNELQRVVQHTANDKEWRQCVTANNREWWNEWIRMRVSETKRFYVSKETKGQSGRPIRFLNNLEYAIYSYYSCYVCNTIATTFAIFTGKRVCWSLFLVKLQA